MAETQNTRGGADTRTAKEVLRQFERLEVTRNKLVKMGAVNGDATPEQLIVTLRRLVPQGMFE